MKTKTTFPAIPAVDEREPSDVELRAIEDENGADDTTPVDETTAVSADDATPLSIASTPIDLARLGLNQIAYVRQTKVDDQLVWSIHSAAGHPLGAAMTLEQAWGAVVQNDLQPVYVN